MYFQGLNVDARKYSINSSLHALNAASIVLALRQIRTSVRFGLRGPKGEVLNISTTKNYRYFLHYEFSVSAFLLILT